MAREKQSESCARIQMAVCATHIWKEDITQAATFTTAYDYALPVKSADKSSGACPAGKRYVLVLLCVSYANSQRSDITAISGILMKAIGIEPRRRTISSGAKLAGIEREENCQPRRLHCADQSEICCPGTAANLPAIPQMEKRSSPQRVWHNSPNDVNFNARRLARPGDNWQKKIDASLSPERRCNFA